MEGFSKLSKIDKLAFLASTLPQSEETIRLIKSFWHHDEKVQQILDDISENTITNFSLPYGIAPNFIINGNTFHVPMVTEESSVVAAAAAAAKFWAARGGFHTKVLANLKTGQIHFIWKGDPEKLKALFIGFIGPLKDSAGSVSHHMESRGGGILKIELLDFTNKIPGYFQIMVYFGTADSMGANYINSCLEKMAVALKGLILNCPVLFLEDKNVEIIMSILSNYNPQCTVECWVECNMSEMNFDSAGLSTEEFVRRFQLAIRIAEIDIHRAVTHNKGILNGIDAVAIATGNDFRAIEAGAHAWASRNGQYSSLSRIDVSSGKFRFTITIPMALGTVGGITNIHPLTRLSMALLGNPDANLLMQITCAAGLATHFAALRSLVTTGIQKGHMKMHVRNILFSLNANESERSKVVEHFLDKTVSYSEVRDFLENLRNKLKP